ncbi:hypothetical protein RRG08_046215 [Elysia crispata]|uniref:Mutator-like transposase domain-containing protein n=1 Tax=Elysia crispata TaxID=231223 RepID=A0AAE1D1N1_9GAST|nr:hypothetical protein RRG08_046215 [Elysia crispata]
MCRVTSRPETNQVRSQAAFSGQWARENKSRSLNNAVPQNKQLVCFGYDGGGSCYSSWAQCVEKFRLKYTTFVGDGDSKAYNKVCDLTPYGPDVEIEKEECLYHVGKRMGAALRNVVSDCSKRGITLGGRGSGRLTANAIRKLSIYYTRGIRSHDTAAEMKKAILASLHHCYSTDEHPQHSYCPSGPDSWCFFKKGLARHHRLSECRAKKRLTKSLERSQAAEKKRKRMRKEAIERAQREATEEEAAAYAPGMH